MSATFPRRSAAQHELAALASLAQVGAAAATRQTRTSWRALRENSPLFNELVILLTELTGYTPVDCRGKENHPPMCNDAQIEAVVHANRHAVHFMYPRSPIARRCSLDLFPSADGSVNVTFVVSDDTRGVQLNDGSALSAKLFVDYSIADSHPHLSRETKAFIRGLPWREWSGQD